MRAETDRELDFIKQVPLDMRDELSFVSRSTENIDIREFLSKKV